MRTRIIFWLFVLLSLAYVLITYFTPVEQSALVKYSLSASQARFLQMTIALPLVAIWFVAYYGWSKIAHYAGLLTDAKEGPPTRMISNGLLFLVLWLPVVSSTSALSRSVYLNHPSLTAPLIILTNYINLIILLVSTGLLAKGSYELSGLAKNNVKWRWSNLGMASVVLLSFFYVYVTLSNPYRMNAIHDGVAAYYLPDWLLASTIIFPYLVVFYLGFRSVQNMHRYKHGIKGVVYRDGVKYIANGIGVTLLGVLAIRYLVSMASVFDSASLRIVLAIIYALVLVIAFGFLLLAKGANRLKKIEEI